MKATIKVTRHGVGEYLITAKQGRQTIAINAAMSKSEAEMKADVMEQELIDCGYIVTVKIAA